MAASELERIAREAERKAYMGAFRHPEGTSHARRREVMLEALRQAYNAGVGDAEAAVRSATVRAGECDDVVSQSQRALASVVSNLKLREEGGEG